MSAEHNIFVRFLRAALIIIALFLISCRGLDTPHITQGSKNNSIETDKFKITAGSVRKEGNQLVFQGGVEVKFDPIVTISSNKTIFHFSNFNTVKLMEFIGNVQMLTDNAKITSDEAFSNNIIEYIEFEGNVNVCTESGSYEYDHYKYYFNDTYRFIVPDIQALSR